MIKILTGELRIGLKDGLLEEALAVAFQLPAEGIREANMLLGDLGRVAVLAKHGNLGASRTDVVPTHQVDARQPGADGGGDLGAGAIRQRLVSAVT